MASLAFKANWRKNTSKARLGEYAQALLGGVTYTLIPTVFGMSGAWGMVTGLATGTLIGILTDMPGMTAGTVGCWGAHAMYLWAQEPVESVTGNYIWRYNPAGVVPAGTNPGGVYGLSEGGNRQMVTLPNGQTAYAYRAGDLPSVSYPELPQGSMSDYYDRGMSDHYDVGPSLGDRPLLPSARTTRDSIEMELF